jgi:GxxExxY protein
VDENQIGDRILDCAFKVHKALGPGLLESAYEACLAHDLGKLGLAFQRQVALPLSYDGLEIETAYRLDPLVENIVVVEVKAVDALASVHPVAQLSEARRVPPRLSLANGL